MDFFHQTRFLKLSRSHVRIFSILLALLGTKKMNPKFLVLLIFVIITAGCKSKTTEDETAAPSPETAPQVKVASPEAALEILENGASERDAMKMVSVMSDASHKHFCKHYMSSCYSGYIRVNHPDLVQRMLDRVPN